MQPIASVDFTGPMLSRPNAKTQEGLAGTGGCPDRGGGFERMPLFKRANAFHCLRQGRSGLRGRAKRTRREPARAVPKPHLPNGRRSPWPSSDALRDPHLPLNYEIRRPERRSPTPAGSTGSAQSRSTSIRPIRRTLSARHSIPRSVQSREWQGTSFSTR